ncbi:MAG: ABC transporter permease [Eubacterium sp.]|nr:ABC transporter permease [Eubacterium sp.]
MKAGFGSSSFGRYLKKNMGILLALFALILVFGVLTKFSFLASANLINIVRVASLDAIVAFGATLVIINGGIDLSVGSIEAIASTYCAFVILNTNNYVLAIIVGIALALAFGCLNGFLVSSTNIPPFIVTLGTMNIVRGIAYMASAGTPIRIETEFGAIGNGYLFDLIPYPILYAIVILIIMSMLLNKTKFGRSVYAIGGNAEAARFSGINIRKVTWIAYTIAGLLYGVVGVVYCSRLYSGQPTLGQGAELSAIAAAVVGGTSMSGGVGRMGSTFIGALIISVLNTGLNYLNVPFYWQDVCEGIVILGAVYFDLRTKKK